MGIPAVTVAQMREVDRLMVEEIGVSILMMMENASRHIAVLSRRMLGGSVNNKNIVILCGKGNNGGDGLGAARHLINFGAKIVILLAANASQLRHDPNTQYNILKNINATVYEAADLTEGLAEKYVANASLIIDALLGYNAKGRPKEPIATFIKLSNQSQKPILAVDIPSGLNADTGEATDPTIKAAVTLTLALPKVGLLTEKAREYVGKLYVADLSVPKMVYNKLGINVPAFFAKEELVKVD